MSPVQSVGVEPTWPDFRTGAITVLAHSALVTLEGFSPPFPRIRWRPRLLAFRRQSSGMYGIRTREVSRVTSERGKPDSPNTPWCPSSDSHRYLHRRVASFFRPSEHSGRKKSRSPEPYDSAVFSKHAWLLANLPSKVGALSDRQCAHCVAFPKSSMGVLEG